MFKKNYSNPLIEEKHLFAVETEIFRVILSNSRTRRLQSQSLKNNLCN